MFKMIFIRLPAGVVLDSLPSDWAMAMRGGFLGPLKSLIARISLYFSSSQHSLIQPSPTSNSTKFAPSIMPYNAHFALKFGWISIKIEGVIEIFRHAPRYNG